MNRPNISNTMKDSLADRREKNIAKEKKARKKNAAKAKKLQSQKERQEKAKKEESSVYDDIAMDSTTSSSA